MNVSRRYPGRLLLALAAAVAALVIGAATAWGQTAPSDGPSTGAGVSGSSGSSGVSVSSGTVQVGPTGVVSSGIAAPAWCCGTTGSVPGLTVVGQATEDGHDTAARDAAIASAVKDATDQAQTAADAAGIQLGAIIDLEVSSMPFFTPMMGGAAGSSTGSPDGGTVEPMSYQSSVSVTVTWALGGA
ncbi:MAG: SIMPL domain-containing protein [Actinomycetota bacterium]